MNTIIIPILASSVNVGASLHAVGLPSANAISGFGHAALRLIKEMTGANPSDQGSALVINKYTLTTGRKKPASAEQGDMSRVKAGSLDASLSDERLAVIEGWVIVRFGVGLTGLSTIQDKLSDIAEQLHSLSFAGGVLSIPAKLRIFENDDNGSEAFGKLPANARVVVDQTHDLERYAKAYNLDFFEAMIRLLVLSDEQGKSFYSAKAVEVSDEREATPEPDASIEPKEDNDSLTLESSTLPMDDQSVEDRALFEQTYLGHLVPIDIGYRALEEPQNRTARGHYQHVFAEPVTGIARIQLISSLKRRKDSVHAFWQHTNEHPMYISKGAVQHG